MIKPETIETLNKILNSIYNAMDHIGDIEDNNPQVTAAEKQLVTAAMQVDNLIDELEEAAHAAGARSGAV